MSTSYTNVNDSLLKNWRW